MNNKGQSALEFVLLVGFMLIVFFMFFFVIQERMVDTFKLQEQQILKEASNVIVNEFDVARFTLPDYQRTFFLPSAGANEYSTQLKDPLELLISYNDVMVVRFLSEPVYGYIKDLLTDDGENIIYKTDGVIHLFNGSTYFNEKFRGVFLNVNPETCYLIHVYDEGGKCDEGDIEIPSPYSLPDHVPAYDVSACVDLQNQLDLNFDFCPDFS
jgi:hypothetical protein